MSPTCGSPRSTRSRPCRSRRPSPRRSAARSSPEPAGDRKAAAIQQPDGYDGLNDYARIIGDEAMRRGISVLVADAGTGELVLTFGDRRVTTVESLSELTSALAFKRCDHKGVTRRVLQAGGLTVPPGRMAQFNDSDVAFLAEWDEIVVKPARGEQGMGITVGVTEPDDLPVALETARHICPEVLLEARAVGDDLRIIVIGGEVVAASVRRPPTIVGDGQSTVAELILTLSAERSNGTGGASTIPLDATTRQAVTREGYRLGSVLDPGVEVMVRHTANLHTGGSIHDVTDDLHPELAAVAVRAAEIIGIPVLGLDLIVDAPDLPNYTIIEANEQPGLANHEPRPTAERFIDVLFPETAGR